MSHVIWISVDSHFHPSSDGDGQFLSPNYMFVADHADKINMGDTYASYLFPENVDDGGLFLSCMTCRSQKCQKKNSLPSSNHTHFFFRWRKNLGPGFGFYFDPEAIFFFCVLQETLVEYVGCLSGRMLYPWNNFPSTKYLFVKAIRMISI